LTGLWDWFVSVMGALAFAGWLVYGMARGIAWMDRASR
jgi:hypothetical protein